MKKATITQQNKDILKTQQILTSNFEEFCFGVFWLFCFDFNKM